MSAVTAACEEFKKQVQIESGGWGDEAEALKRCARAIRVSPSVADKIKRGKRKTMCGNLMQRIWLAGIRRREKEVTKLLSEIDDLKRIGGSNDALETIEIQTLALADQIAAARLQIERQIT